MMKKFLTFFVAIALFQSVALGQSLSVTYTAGDIPTDYQSPWVGPSTCPGEMTVTVPAGNWITGVDVTYSMTAANAGWMSDQRSRLFSPTLGLGEDAYAVGTGSAGTMTYNRVNLDFANYGTGNVIFQLDAGRTFGNTAPNNGCGTWYNKVDNNTWVLTVYYAPIPPCPAPFLLTVSNITSTSAVLSWTPLGTETLWNVKYGAPGFDPATQGTLIAGLTSPTTTLTGLTPLTAYEFYVQSDCGSGDLSPWAGPQPFMTIADLISGTFTINSTLPTAGNNFNSFSDLAIALNTGGLDGPLTVNVVAGTGPYNEQVIIGEVIGSSAVNTITINGNGETLEYLSTNTNERATLKLNGTDYVTIDNLVIKALGSLTGEFGYAVHLMNGANYNTFTNSQFISDLTSTSINFAAFVSSNSNTSATLAGLAVSNLTVTNCVAIGGYYGMVINGPTNTAGPPHSENNVITNNVIKDFRLYGLYMRGQNNSLYAENTIHRPDRDNVSTTYMLYITQNMNGTQIINNEVYEFAGNATATLSAYGIYGTGITCSPGSELLIANNLVYGFEGMNGLQRGIVLFTTDHAKVYHNTISVDNVDHTGTSAIQGIYHTGNLNTIDIRNNIVSITSNSTGTKHCLYFSQTAANAPILTSNNNVLYMGATAGDNHIAYWTGSSYTTLANWQAAGGGAYDQNSKADEPIFVDLPNGNLTPMSPYINNIGANLLADVPFDFYGEPRTTTPDPGAIEFLPVGEGVIAGVVRDAATNNPVTGALVTIAGFQTLTNASGAYEFTLMGGDYIANVQKIGYETLMQTVTVIPFESVQTDLLLNELANAPGAVLAALNASQTAVNLNWGLPGGPYEITYDDGSFENMTAWQQAGNANALRFTPIAHPVQVIGGSIHIGDGTYPPSQNIPNTFEVAVYSQDASPFGWPAEELARFDVNRGGQFGWITFELPETVTITSGDFYIAMIQVGNFPNTIGIAIDETPPLANRSYSKFGTGPWTLAGYQDFMIRAVVSGPGGPGGGTLSATPQIMEPTRHHRDAVSMYPAKSVGGMVGDAQYIPINTGMPAPEELVGYNVYRFEQGNEGDESQWTAVGTPANNAFVDNGWTALPDGAYRWAVKARYTGNRLSPPTFSNVLGKGFTVDAVTFNMSLSSGNTPVGIEVVMINQLVPDTLYVALSGDNGVVVFNDVWKGTYDITVYKFGFEVWSISEELTANKTYNIMLWQMANPARNLYVDDRTLMATWDNPIMQALILEETFSSGSFATNQWTSEPNWAVWTGFGNPAPSARFNWSPAVTNYSRSLTSKLLTGVGSPEAHFHYDIYLSNFGITTPEKMAIELWDGAEWITLKTYDNQAGNIPWTSEMIDITEYVDGNFQVRFRAYGDDSYNINNWNVDNVRVLGVETDFSVMGYNFYLNDLQIDFTTDTELQIPPALITYGQTYLAEVAAVYQSGVSPRIGYTFTSYFLPAPRELAGINVENAVQLTWLEPVVPAIESGEALDIPVVTDYPKGLYAPSTGLPPADGVPTVNCDMEPINLSDFFRGTTAWAINNSTGQIVSMDTDAPGTLTNLGAYGGSGFSNAGDFPLNETSFLYELENNGSFKKITLDPFNVQVLGTIYGDWTGMATNPLTGTIYAITTTQLYTIDPVALTSTLVGPAGSGMNIALAIDGNGDGWTYDLADDSFYKVDLATGARTLIGSIGFDANFGQGMTWDSENDRILMAAFNNTTFQSELRVADRNTGATTMIAPIGNVSPGGTVQCGWIAIPYMMGASPAEGLLGYNIYRGNALHAFVEAPELEFWDLNMMPGTYKYSATAVYDLTVFGLTGTDESLHTAEIEVDVNNFGFPLPFVEEWESANFGYNNWLIGGDDGHWRVTTAQGNPYPAAEFTWSPPVKDYEYTLISPALNAAIYNCADVYLEFDLKLNDRNATGNENLSVQYYVNGNWVPVTSYQNLGSFNWSPQSLHLPLATGKTFHVRFVASGDNSADLLSWFIDNIHVFAECRAPMDLDGDQMTGTYDVYLEWTEPDCETGSSGQLVKLSQWDGAPTNAYFQSYNMGYGVVYDLTSYPDATLEFIDFHHASWGVMGTWDYKIHVVNWSTYQLIATIDDLRTTGNDKWENGILLGEILGLGGGLVGIIMEPLSNSPTDAYPCFSADNDLNGVSVSGQIPNWSAFAPSGVGDFLQNLWIRTNFVSKDEMVKLSPVNLSDHTAETRRPAVENTGGELMQFSKLIPSVDNASKDDPVQGYNIYRSDDEGETFSLITPAPVNDLTYVDPDMAVGLYHYYITALYDVCESVPSNILEVDVKVGIQEIDDNGISIYPVPATTHLTMVLTDDIRNIHIINYMGQMVFEQNVVKDKVITLNTAGYAPGAYMVQFINESGQTITRRVVITK